MAAAGTTALPAAMQQHACSMQGVPPRTSDDETLSRKGAAAHGP